MRLASFGSDFDRLTIFGYRLLLLPLIGINISQIVMRLGKVQMISSALLYSHIACSSCPRLSSIFPR